MKTNDTIFYILLIIGIVIGICQLNKSDNKESFETMKNSVLSPTSTIIRYADDRNKVYEENVDIETWNTSKGVKTLYWIKYIYAEE